MKEEKDLRIEIRFRNNVIFTRIKEMYGNISLPKFCELAGLSYGIISPVVSFKVNVYTKRAGKSEIEMGGGFYWTKTAVKLAEVLKSNPEDLFPEQLREVRKNTYVTEASSAEVFYLMNQEQKLLEDEFQERDLEAKVSDVLSTLTERYEGVIRKRFFENKS